MRLQNHFSLFFNLVTIIKWRSEHWLIFFAISDSCSQCKLQIFSCGTSNCVSLKFCNTYMYNYFRNVKPSKYYTVFVPTIFLIFTQNKKKLFLVLVGVLAPCPYRFCWNSARMNLVTWHSAKCLVNNANHSLWAV